MRNITRNILITIVTIVTVLFTVACVPDPSTIPAPSEEDSFNVDEEVDAGTDVEEEADTDVEGDVEEPENDVEEDVEEEVVDEPDTETCEDNRTGDDVCVDEGATCGTATNECGVEFDCGDHVTCEESDPTCEDTGCPETSETDWSSCEPVDAGNVCSTTGTQSRTVTSYSCEEEGCVESSSQETQDCTLPDTTGNNCGSTEYGNWSSCNFASECAETGERSRIVTLYECGNETCTPSEFTATETCVRETSTEGNSCGAGVVEGNWDACGGFTDECGESGTQSRTVTTSTCGSGTCGSSGEMEVRSCTRPSTDGNSCGDDNRVCDGGSCTGCGDTMCEGMCISENFFQEDDNNCGTCGNVCGITEECNAGSCVQNCPEYPGYKLTIESGNEAELEDYCRVENLKINSSVANPLDLSDITSTIEVVDGFVQIYAEGVIMDTHLDTFQNLRTIGTYLRIFGAQQIPGTIQPISSLNGLSSLEEIGGLVHIRYIEHSQTVDISVLNQLNNIGGQVRMETNDSICQDDAQEVCDTFGKGGDQCYLSSNNGQCN